MKIDFEKINKIYDIINLIEGKEYLCKIMTEIIIKKLMEDTI